MFQVTPKYPGAMIRWLAVAVILSLVSISLVESFALFSVNASNAVVLGFAAILRGGFASYALTTIMLQQQRRRKVPDVTMDFWRFGLLCLLLALTIMALSRTGQISHPRIDLVLGSLMIVGFTMSLITGMLYKIIPFLVWLHMTQTIEMSNRWELKIPNMKKIVSDKNARNQFRMHMLAVGLMLVALFVADLVRFAATVFMISNLYLAFNLISGALVFRRFVRM